MSVEHRLAEHMADLDLAAVPDRAARAFDRLLLDTMAVLLAGLSDPLARRAAAALSAGSAPGVATIAARGRCARPAEAAFAHGVLAHWWEWDDTHDASHVHASATVFPALIAAAETAASEGRPVDGAMFLATAVAAFDVACRIGYCLKRHGHRGWMPTGSGGAIGAAAGAARLLGLDIAGIRSAMGIAAAEAGLSRQALADQVTGKNILAGVAAERAVRAALLARAGVRGAPNFLSGPYGLIALHTDGRADTQAAVDGLGRRFSIAETSVKPYPCCRSVHPALDLVFDLKTTHPHLGERLRALRITAPVGVYERVGRPFAPGDDPRVAAQFNLRYGVALALAAPRVAPADFAAETVLARAAALQPVLDRITVERGPDRPGGDDASVPLTMAFTLADGTVVERTAERLRGAPDHPLSAEEEALKLETAVGDRLPDDGVARLRAAVAAVPRDGIAPLMRILAGADPGRNAPTAAGMHTALREDTDRL